MKESKILPVGSVVKLKNVEKPTMIVSLKTKDNTNTNYTYAGVPFPIGFIGSEALLYFNNERIEDVYFLGYTDLEIEKYIKKMEGE